MSCAPLVVKLGGTVPDRAARCDDFEYGTIHGMGVAVRTVTVIDPPIGGSLSAPVALSGSAPNRPSDAGLLATSNRDPGHAFRISTHVWGMQFSPEITRAYTRHSSPNRQDDLIRQCSAAFCTGMERER